MDEVVKRAMLKWPDVPNVCGWLRLDRRGNWLVRDATGAFGRIGNQSIVDFIGRNYHADERGRWYFQNGPQRVFVTLDYTPFVFRLDDRHAGWLTHAGADAGQPLELLLDEDHALVLVTTLGAGLVLDRDLSWVLDHLSDAAGGTLEAETFIARLEAGESLDVQFLGSKLHASRLVNSTLAGRFGFVALPEADAAVAPDGGSTSAR